MQAVEVYACIPHGFSMKRNHTGRHCLMPVLWKSSVSYFRCCRVLLKNDSKPLQQINRILPMRIEILRKFG